MTDVAITTEFIKLEAALKLCNACATGGEAKNRILFGDVTVNGQVCTQRGRKLREGDVFACGGQEYRIYGAE